MPQAPWALARFTAASGSLVCGQLLNNLSVAYKELFLIAVQLICGVLSGLRGRSSSFVMMSKWWLYCHQVLPEMRT